MISFKSRDNLLAFIANFLRSGMGMFLFLRSGMGLFLFWDHCTFDHGQDGIGEAFSSICLTCIQGISSDYLCVCVCRRGL